jgi:hypothetical protein
MRHGRGASCPPDETLCGFADGTLATGREEIESHLAGCEACLDVVSCLALASRGLDGSVLADVPPELERRARGDATAGESPDRLPWRRRLGDLLFSYRTAGTLAAASLVALGVLWVGPGERLPGDAPSPTRDATAAAAPLPIAPRGELEPGATVTFRWEPGPGVERSVITIVDADAGRLVAREAVSGGEFAIARERLARTGGPRFEWTVECSRADGRVAVSPAVAFELGESTIGE